MTYEIRYNLQGRPIVEKMREMPDFFAYIRACEKCLVDRVTFECFLSEEDLP